MNLRGHIGQWVIRKIGFVWQIRLTGQQLYSDSTSFCPSSVRSLPCHRVCSIDKNNQYIPRAWTDALYSHLACIPVVKPRQIVGRWAAERFFLHFTQPADSMLHDTTIRGWQASVFVFTVRLATRIFKQPSMRMECKFEFSINLWMRWFNLNCLFAFSDPPCKKLAMQYSLCN